MKKIKFISAYILLDEVTLTEQQQADLEVLKKEYMLEFDEIKTISKRTLYYIIIRDKKFINDQTDDENNTTYGLLTVFGKRHPEILCAFNYDGTQLGTAKAITPATYDEETGEVITEEIINFTGEAEYPLKETTYLSYMNDIIETDEEGEEISRTRPTKCDSIRLFSGFNKPYFD